MKNALDLSKFRKDITKNLSGISVGFHDPKTWIDTGSKVLNYIISNDFNRGVPLGKVTILAGESGAGKSFLASGNLVRNAQSQGIFVVLIDSENALDESWLHALGVDTDPEKLMKINACMIDDVAKIINDFMVDYKKEYTSVPRDDRPKVLFVIDSLGMLMTPTDTAQFEKGELKGDMGRKPKALKALITNCVNQFGEFDVGLISTNHVYSNQSMFATDPAIISGGQGGIYAASIVVIMDKRKLKEDEEGNKTTEVQGIKAAVRCVKSRYSQPFQSCVINIPYETGMDPYSGLIELFEKKELLVKDGNKLKYTYLDGTEGKWFRKQITNDIIDKIIDEFPEQIERKNKKDTDASESYESI